MSRDPYKRVLVEPGESFLSLADILHTIEVRTKDLRQYMLRIHNYFELGRELLGPEVPPACDELLRVANGAYDVVDAEAARCDEFNDVADAFLCWMDDHYEDILDLRKLLDRASTSTANGYDLLPSLFIHEDAFDDYALNQFIESFGIPDPAIHFLDETKVTDAAGNSHRLWTMPYSKQVYLWSEPGVPTPRSETR